MTCPVCMEEMENGQTHSLQCNHQFHTECILRWFRGGHPQCPVCRYEASVDSDSSSMVSSDFTDPSEDLEYHIETMSIGEVRVMVNPFLREARHRWSPRALRVATSRYTKADLAMKDARKQVALHRRASNGPFAPLHKRFVSLVRSQKVKETRFRRAAHALILSSE